MDEVIINLSKYTNMTSALKRVRSVMTKTINTIAGKYGNGEDRKTKLGADYELVQSIINLLYEGGLKLK